MKLGGVTTYVIACLILAGCAGKHWSVCVQVPKDPTSYCRAGYRHIDARIAAETIDLTPLVDHAWAAKTPKSLGKTAHKPALPNNSGKDGVTYQ